MLYDPKWEQKTEVCNTLLRAAEIIRERGLAKCRRESPDGSVCLHGAISMARFGHAEGPSGSHEGCDASAAVHRYLLAHGAGYLTSDYGSARWNNQEDRTPDEVIAALEGAVQFV